MKAIVITGANRGVGHVAARHLTGRGQRIILVCRDEGRGREALDALAGLPGDAGHHLVTADLASLDSVRACVHTILELDTPVTALVNNAATVPGERMLSRDGFEMQLAVTHLAHFVLSNLLLPALRRGPAPSRVVGRARRSPLQLRRPELRAASLPGGRRVSAEQAGQHPLHPRLRPMDPRSRAGRTASLGRSTRAAGTRSACPAAKCSPGSVRSTAPRSATA